MLTHGHAAPRAPDRVAVVGAGGFLGHALLAHLAALKIAAKAIGRADVDLTANGAADRLAVLLEHDDTVVFLSALTPDKGKGDEPFLANLRIGASVCAAIERTRPAHVIYVSSDAVYPFRQGLVNEDSCAEPADLYGAMHLARELMVKQAAKSPVAVLRPTLIYGVGDTHNSYGPNRFRRMAREHGRIVLFGGGEETRDHIAIDDVARLIGLVVGHRSAGTLNVATGRSVSFAGIAAMVAGCFAGKVDIATTPRQNPVSHRAFDIAALLRAFPGFAFTPLEQGLAAVHRQEAGQAR
ncbi:MAG: NAD-dependent epimerase/dehydratase family protein [Rhodospirillales bacterium]